MKNQRPHGKNREKLPKRHLPAVFLAALLNLRKFLFILAASLPFVKIPKRNFP